MLDCNYFYNGNFTVENAEIEGEGYIKGKEINADFEGSFSITGSQGYLTSGSISSWSLYISDYYIVNGNGSIKDILLNETIYPNTTGYVKDVKVDMEGSLDLLELILNGKNISLGTMISVLKDGFIFAETSECPSIIIHFIGSNMIEVEAACISPVKLFVNMDTGKIIYTTMNLPAIINLLLQ